MKMPTVRQLLPLLFFVFSVFAGSVSAQLYTVNNNADDGSVGTLRDAINEVNLGNFDAIDFVAGMDGDIISLGSPLPNILNDVVITGPGNGNLQIDGAGAHRIFEINVAGADFTLSNLILTNGFAPTGGAILFSAGSISVDNVSFLNNLSDDFGGAVHLAGVAGSADIVRSYFEGNRAQNGGSFGGALHFDGGGAIALNNSTFYNNQAEFGGAVSVGLGGTINLFHVTASGNTAVSGQGGGLWLESSSLANVIASIFYQNNTNDIQNDGSSSIDFQNERSIVGAPGYGGPVLNQASVTDGSTDFQIVDAGGSPSTIPEYLNSRGFFIPEGTEAVNAALSNTQTIDQLGTNRGTGTHTLGALEINLDPVTTLTSGFTTSENVAIAFAPSIADDDNDNLSVTVTSTYGGFFGAGNGFFNVDGTSGATTGGDGTNTVSISGTVAQVNAELALLEFEAASAGPRTILLDVNDGWAGYGGNGLDSDNSAAGVTGTYTVTSTFDSDPATSGSLRGAIVDANGVIGADVIDATGITGTISLANDLDAITDDVTINGPGVGGLSVDGGSTYSLFENVTDDDLTITGITLQNGLANAGGGAIFQNSTGTLVVERVHFLSNSTPGGAQSGGAISVSAGNVSISRSLFEVNTAGGSGGAITLSGGVTSISNSTFAGNTASAGEGGAIEIAAGTLDLDHVTISSNTASTGGHGISSGGTVTLNHSVLYGNGAEDLNVTGGSFDAESTANIIGTSTGTVSNNGSVTASDPGLGSLQINFGGETETMTVGANAIDVAVGSTETVDQIGQTRPVGAERDLGALEMTVANTAPTAADFTLAFGVGETNSIETGDFGYNDGDGDPIVSVTIVTLPSAGTLFLDLNDNGLDDGGGESIAANDAIAFADLDLSRLNYISTTIAGNGSFTFTVNDGTDDSTPANTATLYSVENALDFDGVNDYVSVPNAPSFQPGTGDFSVEFWFRSGYGGTIPNAIKFLLTNYGQGTSSGGDEDDFYRFYFTNDDQFMTFDIRDNGGTTSTVTSVQTDLLDDNWHHVVGVRDIGSGDLILYVDGIQSVATLTASGSISTDNDLIIGGAEHPSGPPQDFFVGQFDELHYWSVVRTATEVRTNATTRLSNPAGETNLQLYYDFNQGIPSGDNTGLVTISDLSSAGNDGTLTAFDLTGGAVSNWVASTAFASTAATTPSMVVTESSTIYPDGGTAYDYGSQTLLSNTDVVFQIENHGLADLILSSPPTLNVGTHFSLESTYAASTTVTPGASQAITVRYTPATAASHVDFVSMASNDVAVSPYQLNIEGSSTPVVTIVAAHFFDTNDDGDIDEMVVELSEEVDETSADIDDFSTSTGLTINAISTVASTNVGNALDANDADEYVTFEVTMDAASTSTSALSIVFTKDLDGDDFEAQGSGVAANDEADVTEVDAADPVIINHVITANSYSDVTFSEPVWSDFPNTTEVLASNFTIDISNQNGEAISGINESPATDAGDANTLDGGETVVRIFFTYSPPAAVGDEVVSFDTDGGIHDAAGNTAATTQFSPANEASLVAGTPPSIVSAEWLDQDADGNIDAVELYFSIDWDIDEEGAGGDATDAADGLECIKIRDLARGVPLINQDNFDYDNVNNGFYTAGTSLVITFAGDPIDGTGITDLTIEYDDSDNNDVIESQANSTHIVNGSTPALYIDGADPHFSNFTATVLDDNGDGTVDRIEVFTHDEIDDSLVDGLDFVYNGVQASASAINQNITDQIFTLGVTNGTSTIPEGDLVFVGGSTGSLADVDGNTLVAASQTILLANIIDGAPPVIISASTGETSAPAPDGVLDFIALEISEDVTGAGVIGDYDVTGVNETGTMLDASNVIQVSIDGAYGTTDTPGITISDAAFTDLAGNDFSGPETIGTTDGAAPFAQVADDGTNTTYVTYPRTYGSLSITIDGRVDDPGALVFVEIDGNGNLASVDGGGLWSVNTSVSDQGTYDVDVTTFDSNGNIGSDYSTDEVAISGGVTITPADAPSVVCENSDFVTLNDLVIMETDPANFAIQSGRTILLSLPEDFFFDTDVAPTVGVTGSEVVITTDYIGNAILRINVNVSGIVELNTVTIGDLSVTSTGDGVGALVDLTRFGGDATVFGASTNGQVFGSMEDAPTPADLVSIDVVVGTPTPNITEYASRVGESITLNADDASNTVNWYDYNDVSVFAGSSPTEVDLAASGYFDNTIPGLYTFYVEDDNGNCQSNPLKVNILIYDDDDFDSPGSPSFVTRTYNLTDAPDNIYVSNPAGHSVAISSDGSGFQTTSTGDPLTAEFDPGVAGLQSSPGHLVTYQIRNNVSGEIFELTRELTVQAATTLFDNAPLDYYCIDDSPVTFSIDGSQFNATYGVDPYIQYLTGVGRRHSGGVFDINGQDLHDNTNVNGSNPPVVSNTYEFTFEPARFNVPPGDFEHVYFESVIRDADGVKRVGAEDYFIIYGEADLDLSNITNGQSYCSDEGAFTIQRDIQYVSTMDFSDPADPEPTYFSQTNQNITTGYQLYYSPDGVAPYTLMSNFTGGNLSNEFDPNDPDQNGSTYLDGDTDDIGYYRIDYTTGAVGPNSCETSISKFVEVLLQPAMPDLDAADFSSVGGVLSVQNTDEYLLEICQFSSLPSIQLDGTPDVSIDYSSWTGSNPITTSSFVYVTRNAPLDPNQDGVIDAGYTIVTTGRSGTDTPGTPGSGSLTLQNVGTNLQVGDYINIYDSGLPGYRFGLIDVVNLPVADVTWYNGSLVAISGYENQPIVPSSALGLNASSTGSLSAEQIGLEFYISTTSANGCESDLRKVTVNVYGLADAVELNLASTDFDEEDVQSGTSTFYEYELDYCTATDGGTDAVPDNLVLPALNSGEEYLIYTYFNADEIGNPGVYTYQSQNTFSTNTINISTDVMADGESYRYDIYLRDNINGSTGFNGCQSRRTEVRTYGHNIPSAPTVADFSAGVVDFHVAESAVLSPIFHSNVGMDEYYWYEEDNRAVQIGDELNSGEAMSVNTLKAIATPGKQFLVNASNEALDAGNDAQNDVYTYYVSRLDNIIDGNNFDGCESNTNTPVTITVHAKQAAPAIVSDNSAGTFGQPVSFPDINKDGNVGNDDTDVEYYFAVCLDQVENSLLLIASQGTFGYISNLSGGPFQVGELVTGASSGATAYISTVQSGELMLRDVTGTFIATEEIEGALTGATADLDATHEYGGASSEYRWYPHNGTVRTSATPLYTGDSPIFENLNIGGISAAANRFFEVVQVTDTDVFAGVESESTLIRVEFFDQDDLTFTSISDGDNICYDELGDGAGDIQLELWSDGSAATTSLLTYSVTSSPTDFSDGSINDDQGTGGDGIGNPIVDIDAWHLAAGGSLIGGVPTTHTITMTYIQSNGGCEITNSATITIHPDPDISFTVAGVDINDVNFAALYDEFCYEDGLIELKGILSDGTPLASGDFTSSETGALTTNNGSADMNPLSEHNGFHGVAGTAGEYLNQSTITITYTYSDAFGCERSVSAPIHINPEPEVYDVERDGSLPLSDLAEGRPSNRIRLSDFCSGSTTSTAEIRFVDPQDTDPGSIEEDDYSSYVFEWTINGVPTPDANLDGNPDPQVGVNTIGFTPSANNLNISVVVTDLSGCEETFTETHTLQSLPSLDIVGISDGDIFCSQDSGPGQLVLTDATLDGEGNPSIVNDANVSWQVDSWNSDDATPIMIDSGVGVLPDIDNAQLLTWHIAAGGDDDSGESVGGVVTYHTISVNYIDDSRRYQGVQTMCPASISKQIEIYPDPDITFSIAGADDDNVVFCYDDGEVNLIGLFADLTNLENPSGGSFSGLGVGSTSNSQTTISPADIHDAYWSRPVVDGGLGIEDTYPFRAQSINEITFTYTDINGCENSVTKTVFVNPRPHIDVDLDPSITDAQINFDAICKGYPTEASVTILQPKSGTDPIEPDVPVTDFTGYTFTWESDQGTFVSGDPEVFGNTVVLPADDLNINISLTVTVESPDGCVVELSDTETQGFPPEPSFTYVGITANSADGLDIEFQENNPLLTNTDVDTLAFELRTYPGGVLVADEYRGVSEGTVDYFETLNITGLDSGQYEARVWMGTPKGCFIPDSARIITILPLKVLSDPQVGYSENFNTDTGDPNMLGDWYIEVASEDGKNDTTRNVSWKRMDLTGTGTYNDNIISDGRGGIVVTHAPEAMTSYYSGEVSFVYSPAFDMSTFANPAIKFEHIRDFESSRDGLVVQVSEDDGRTWKTLGDNDINSGIEWYTHQGIASAPGQNVGRYPETGTSVDLVGFADVDRDNDDNSMPIWKESRHLVASSDEVDPVDYSGPIRFRFALGASIGDKINSDLGILADGFAFDNFEVYEVNKVMVVEQFSSTLSGDSKDYEDFIAGTSVDWEEGTQGVWINYFTDMENQGATVDPINARNKVDPSTRATYYGVKDVPDTRIGGVDIPYDLVDTPEDFINGFSALALSDADFEINKNDSGGEPDDIVINSSESDVVSVTTTFRYVGGDLDDVEVGFFFAIVEKVKTGVTSGVFGPTDVIHYPLRVMLPGPEGYYYRGDLTTGQEFTYDVDWTISGIDDPGQLRVISFVQFYDHPSENKVGSIEQASFVDFDGLGKTNTVVGLEDLLTNDVLELYPNPADKLVTLKLADAPLKPVKWKVSDQSGKQVMIGRIERGIKEVTIDTDELPSGLYIIQIFNDENSWVPKKVIISH